MNRALELLREDWVRALFSRSAAALSAGLRTPPYRVHSAAYDHRAPDPTPVMDRDWDVLLLLDACRYDVFTAATTDTYDADTEEQLRALGYANQ